MAPRPSGLWVPERLVPSDEGFAERVTKYITVALTISTGLAYLLGVWSVARFSEGVGTTPADLGFDFRDYLLLAALNLVPVTLGAALAVPGVILTRRTSDERAAKIEGLYLAFAGLGTLLMVLSFLTENYSYLVLSVGLTIGAYGAAVLTYYRRRSVPSMALRGRSNMILFLGAIVLVLGVTMAIYFAGFASEQYGYDLASVYRTPDTSEIPYGLQLLVNPERGSVVVNGRSECVLRIREKVVSTGGHVVVVNDMDAFVARSRCVRSLDAFLGDESLPSVAEISEGISQTEIENFNTSLVSQLQIAPGADFLSRALIAGLDLCSSIDNQPLEERGPLDLTGEAELAIHFRPFRHFMDNDLSSNDRIKAVVLELTGQELCPAHQQAITEFREHWPRRMPDGSYREGAEPLSTTSFDDAWSSLASSWVMVSSG
jgi:hypothetical protein